jgi:regulator of protease activity HflC (stomatin/prohibitin superfamily)
MSLVVDEQVCSSNVPSTAAYPIEQAQGSCDSIKGAGLFAIIPVLDAVVAVIDGRIQTTGFNAEQALTKDTVPVNVDAIIFWHVHGAEKAALAITNYREAIDRVAQTSLREMIGSSMLASLLSDRKDADEQLKVEIGRKTAPWGISVSSVEIRDVAIPGALQDAMSRQARAEREKQARVILGSAEAAIAGRFVEAANICAGRPPVRRTMLWEIPECVSTTFPPRAGHTCAS